MMGAGHDHGIAGNTNEKTLWMALLLTSAFLIAEVIGGVMTKSLALLSDAAHMLTDVSALAISLVAIRIGKREADAKRTFGYFRFEILAAAFNALLLFAVAIYIVFEAWQRLLSPPHIQSGGMLVIAVIGLIVNAISLRLLSGGKDTSLNVKGAYLEVWSDMLGSIGVIIGAVLIRYTHWSWVDSVIAVGIGVWVLPRTWLLLKDSMNVLLNGVPDGIDLDAIRIALQAVPGVSSIHDLHVWAIASNEASLTAHVVYDAAKSGDEVRRTLESVLETRFAIHHTTLQLETAPCGEAPRHR